MVLWKKILKQFLLENYDLLKETNWMIMGSMATALQGCNIIPNDMDIIMKNKKDVYLLAKLMDKYAINESNEEAVHYNDNWKSTKKNPTLEDEYDKTKDCWTFGRWFMEAYKIECASIIPPEDYLCNKKESDGIWEGGPEIWKYKKYVNFDNYIIPVVPLEVQLETNLSRNYQDRVDKIIDLFNTYSFDKELLIYSLSKKNKEKIRTYCLI
ncbi:hypothetical protein KHQ81_04300 [Mycoplasmatota bacterium]|nr:hypothetical protein KHQ81_04300 [Mycoplasmatota bacterium]